MKLSIYNITEKSERNTILYNSSNGSCVVFENERFAEYERCNLFVDEFYRQGFYVDDDKDEFVELVKKSDEIIHKNDFLKFRILTTTGCNAKCPYCYEKGIASSFMNDDVAKAVVQFIKSKHDDQKKYVEIEWFGGEPLLNTKAIDYICAELNEAGINFFSSMVSNAYLIDDNVLDKMSSLWNLKKIQITLDGRKEEYEKIKGMGAGSYEKVISIINRLSERKIKVDIRLNFNKENFGEIKLLIEELSKYGFNNYVEVYIAKIFDYNKTEQFTLEDEMIALYDDLHKFKLLTRLKLLPRSLETGCMAYYPNFFTIDPKGRLFKCDRRLLDKNSIANVFNYEDCDIEVNVDYNFPEKCKKCSILPTCWGGCLYERMTGENTCYMTEKIYQQRLSLMLKDYEKGV